MENNCAVYQGESFFGNVWTLLMSLPSGVAVSGLIRAGYELVNGRRETLPEDHPLVRVSPGLYSFESKGSSDGGRNLSFIAKREPFWRSFGYSISDVTWR